ncbi:hypothetical protein DSM43519_01383 [Mycobacterium marinum]|nr:hypothetical protein CCUG20998_03927 [Mycobacterium marinum]RFZ26069.1 hypothetical protein DSM43519_01383 [Mycobacterium marinum]RFZ28948.1 hypothetical protein DSM44344_01215 [Mycobacterium marinum]RFZ39134.1 hypothetical protein NCTC2275_00402 [Mycobacterium marinum]
MRVIVDETLCEANGFCESLAPDIFALGDADVVQIADGRCLRIGRSMCTLPSINARKPHCGLSTDVRTTVRPERPHHSH